MSAEPYRPRRRACSVLIQARGLRQHLLEWGDRGLTSAARPTLVMLHGWMDVAASFQFVVDAMADDRHVLALDWRGFGASDTPASDTYYFTEYLGDLELVLDAVFGAERAPIDLLGHSMGGNVAMLYSGVRPDKVRRLVNLEGFGMPRSRPEHAPARIAKWLDELKTPMQLKPYRDLDAVAARLQKTNPLLRADRAAWLAANWSKATGSDAAGGERALLADANHKRMSPLLAQVDEWLESWKRITAPVLWIEGDRSDPSIWWGDRYTKAEFHQRLDLVADVRRHVVAPAGHMLHHDRPEDIAALVESFLSESRLPATPPIE
jgi:pimeloyl-ACP methyl ester carboxylesterase